LAGPDNFLLLIFYYGRPLEAISKKGFWFKIAAAAGNRAPNKEFEPKDFFEIASNLAIE